MALIDSFQREITYLRISVTDRCNLRCQYCMPASGVKLISHNDVLSFEEITEFTRVAVGLGINKVRLTGGEPLVRRHFVELVRMLSQIEGIDDLAMTTNGLLLTEFAKPLIEAGMHRLNISLDTMDEAAFREITRGGELKQLLAGIKAAQKAGFETIKLNCVVQKSSVEKDAQTVAHYAAQEGLEVRFIRQMNLAIGEYWNIEGGSGGDCKACNRLRLTCDGKIKPCLVNDMTFDTRELGAEEAILQAVGRKPKRGEKTKDFAFNAIGG